MHLIEFMVHGHDGDHIHHPHDGCGDDGCDYGRHHIHDHRGGYDCGRDYDRDDVRTPQILALWVS